MIRQIFYTWVSFLTAYYIRLECSVKDFIINKHLCYLRAVNLIQAKKKGGGGKEGFVQCV